MEKLQWKTEVRKLSDLIPVSYNPRSLSDKQAKDLKKSLLKFSLAEIPVINLDNTILAGHQRCKILAQIENKDFEIDVRVPNRQLTPEEADEYLIRSNKNSGEFDFELLENHFSTEDLVDWGFDEDEFEHDVDEVDLPELASGDKEPYQQMTFTLHDEQVDIINEATKEYKKTDGYKYLESFSNENTNGNALYGIVQEWLAQKK